MNFGRYPCSACRERLLWKRKLHTQITALSRLVEVGRMEDPKLYEAYPPGQLFINRIFGYRGVTLFSWVGKVYDRDVAGHRISHNQWEDEGIKGDRIKEMRAERQTYYQALVHNKDRPYVKVPPEAISLIAEHNKKNNDNLYSISGLDYVDHSDMLPYTATDDDPFHHHLFPQLFGPSPEADRLFVPRELLTSWQQKNHRWLKNIDIHRETTRGIRVTVMPIYMGCRDIQQSCVYWWRYTVRLENLTKLRVQLQQRHWRIFSSLGSLETVKGDGVIGQQPVLSPRQPAFQYSSHVSLQAPNGHMWGTFRMEREDGKYFDIRVPPFTLNSCDYS